MNLVKRLYNSLDHRIRYRTLKPILEKIEINYGDLLLPKIANFNYEKLPKIALVKQDVYQDLYCCSPNSSVQEIILSSFQRSGFVGLFTKFNADFLIVKAEQDLECNIWQQKHFDCHQESIEFYLSLQEKHSLYSQSVNEIDWNLYDIVISIDIAIPSRITKQFPHILWCYCIGEPCMRAYQESKLKPIDGYNLFLNQQFRHLSFVNSLPKHEIEFPYYLQYYGCYKNILNLDIKDSEKEGLFIEFNWRKILTEKQKKDLSNFGSIRCPKGIKNILLELAKSKYFLIGEGTRGLWGNGMIEAIASGCLLIGNPLYVKHKSLFTSATVVYNFDQLLQKLAFFENNNNAYHQELEKQRKILDYVCFNRPMNDLLSIIK